MGKYRDLRVLALVVLFWLLACGSDGGTNREACATLKIAGGEGCEPAPAALTVVAAEFGYCSGILITTRHVLTAAHCIPPAGAFLEVISVGQRTQVSSAQVHPLYDGSISSPFDVAVITLSEHVQVTPVPLMLSREVRPGDTVVVYGFGIDESGNDIVQRLQRGESPLKATFLKISAVYPGTVESVSEGGDTCRGDSGASLLLEGANGQPGIVAIVRAGPNVCIPDSDYPSDNSDVQSRAVADFIRRIAPATESN